MTFHRSTIAAKCLHAMRVCSEMCSLSLSHVCGIQSPVAGRLLFANLMRPKIHSKSDARISIGWTFSKAWRVHDNRQASFGRERRMAVCMCSGGADDAWSVCVRACGANGSEFICYFQRRHTDSLACSRRVILCSTQRHRQIHTRTRASERARPLSLK